MSPLRPDSDPTLDPLYLSPVEDSFWRFEERFDGESRVLVLVRLDGCIESHLLTTALQRVQRGHPKLRAMITADADGRYRYRFDDATPAIPFEITDNDQEVPSWREEARRLLLTRFPSAGPLAAVSVLRSRARQRSELFLTIHHAIADGRSAILLVHDLLTEYAAAETAIELPPRRTLPAVTADRAVISPGWRRRLWLLRRVVRLQREEKRARQTRLPPGPDVPPQSQWVHWVFSREDTVRLVRRCRKEQASLTGAMVAAAFCGLVEVLQTSDALFKCQIPLDVREALNGPAGPVTDADLGCFVSVMNEFYQVAQRPAFWDLARRAHHDLQSFVHQSGPALYYNLARAIERLFFGRVTARLLPSSKIRATLLATNYGVVNLHDTYGALRPRECTLTFKSDLIGPSLIMESLVLGHRLNIGLAANAVEPDFWRRLHAAVRVHLDAAAGHL